jgi:hypothetical protein
MSDKMMRNVQWAISKQTLIVIGLVLSSSIIVFIRMLYAEHAFSYDYSAYIFIIKKLSDLSLFDILGSNLVFPYTVTMDIVPVEFGFALLVKRFLF